MRPARVPVELTVRPFTSREAARHGVSVGTLGRGPWVHVLHGVWRHSDLPDSREMRAAAVGLVLTPHAVICGLTAAWLHGIDVQDPRAAVIWVACITGQRMRPRAGLAMRELTLAPGDVELRAGVPVTTPVRTAFDCARWLSATEAVVVLDALAHDELIDLDAFRGYVEAQRGLRWVTRARTAAGVADPRSESPMETRLRLLFVRAGVTCLVPQVTVVDGTFVARLDLADERLKVAAEYDGADHWEQRRHDDRRRDRLRALGWTIIVVSAEDYYRSPSRLVLQVRGALAAAQRAAHPR